MSAESDRSRTSTPASSVPLDDIYDLIRGAIPTVGREDHGLSFRGHLGTTQLNVRPVSVDGRRVIEVITVQTDITGFPIPSSNTEVNLAALNAGAAMSALILLRRGQSTVLVSRLSSFEGDREAWNLYTPLLGFAAVTQSETFCQTILRTMTPSRADMIPETRGASPWGVPDFDEAQDLLGQAGKGERS